MMVPMAMMAMATMMVMMDADGDELPSIVILMMTTIMMSVKMMAVQVTTGRDNADVETTNMMATTMNIVMSMAMKHDDDNGHMMATRMTTLTPQNGDDGDDHGYHRDYVDADEDEDKPFVDCDCDRDDAEVSRTLAVIR